MLGFFELHLRFDTLKLMLDDLDVVLGGAQIDLQFRLLHFLPGLTLFDLVNVFFQVGNCLDLSCVLLLEHLLRLPMRIRQELVNLPTQKREESGLDTYVGSFTLMFSESMMQLVSNSSSLLIRASFCSL